MNNVIEVKHKTTGETRFISSAPHSIASYKRAGWAPFDAENEPAPEPETKTEPDSGKAKGKTKPKS